MIKHLVFDFGGVILDLDGVHTGYPDDLAVIFDIPVAEAQKIWNENKTLVISGKETPAEFLLRTKSELDLHFDTKAGLKYWKEKNVITKDRIDWKLLEEIEKLRSKYQAHMLTDQIQLSNGAEQWINEVHGHFDQILRSYEQGFRKPFPEAYQNLLKKIDAVTEPQSVVFIDDNLQNIEAANEAGIHGILYTFKSHELVWEKIQEIERAA